MAPDLSGVGYKACGRTHRRDGCIASAWGTGDCLLSPLCSQRRLCHSKELGLPSALASIHEAGRNKVIPDTRHCLSRLRTPAGLVGSVACPGPTPRCGCSPWAPAFSLSALRLLLRELPVLTPQRTPRTCTNRDSQAQKAQPSASLHCFSYRAPAGIWVGLGCVAQRGPC